MRTLVALLLAAIAAALPANGNAVRLGTPEGLIGPRPYQHWADDAKVPTPPFDVTLVLGPCPEVAWAAACVPVGSRTIYLAPSGERDRKVFLHELGHVFEHEMSDDARAAFLRLTRDPRPWRSSPNSPHERFAEAYAACAMHRTIGDRFYGDYGYWPGPRLHRKVCALIRDQAVRMGWA